MVCESAFDNGGAYYNERDRDNDTDEESDVESDNDSSMGDFEDGFDVVTRQIYREDEHHMDGDKNNARYYIGLCNTYVSQKTILFVVSVSSRIFHRYSYDNIHTYLKSYSIFQRTHPTIEIMKLNILENGRYTVLIKTHWLRLVQRHWKKTFAERLRVIRRRAQPSSLVYSQQTGAYPDGLHRIPTLYGMLRQYSSELR